MASMKKHQFLLVEYRSMVKLNTADQRKLNSWLKLASQVVERLSREGLFYSEVKSIRISLLICGDQKIKSLNEAHRHKDKVTDVLSFPLHEDLRRFFNNVQLMDGELLLGDLAICLPQARRQARVFNIGLWDEFIHLFFHGLLHLIGFDHEISAQEEKMMQRWEDRAVELFSELRKGA